MLLHPRSDALFRISIPSCGVNMVHAVFQQQLEYTVSLSLRCLTQSIRAENNARACMSGETKKLFGDHWSLPRKFGLTVNQSKPILILLHVPFRLYLDMFPYSIVAVSNNGQVFSLESPPPFSPPRLAPTGPKMLLPQPDRGTRLTPPKAASGNRDTISRQRTGQ